VGRKGTINSNLLVKADIPKTRKGNDGGRTSKSKVETKVTTGISAEDTPGWKGSAAAKRILFVGGKKKELRIRLLKRPAQAKGGKAKGKKGIRTHWVSTGREVGKALN